MSARPGMMLVLAGALLAPGQSAGQTQPAGPTAAVDASMRQALRGYFAAAPTERAKLEKPWEQADRLAVGQVAAWRHAIWQAYQSADGPQQRAWRDDLANRRVTFGQVVMRYTVHTSGEKPPDGWPVLISLHDLDDSDPQAVDRQGQPQNRYSFDGMLVFPRAPGGPDAWQTAEVHELLDLLVRQLLAFADVNPDRVFLQGYGEGGHGVLRLGPNLADRWAAIAAAAAAEQPARIPIENLRNTPLNLQVGQLDEALDRGRLAATWAETMKKLRDDGNPEEYVCEVVVHPGQDRSIDDRSSPAWLSKFTRNPVPRRIVWTQSGPVQRNRYWLRLDDPCNGRQAPQGRSRPETIDTRLGGQLITLNVKRLARVVVRLDDRMLDLDRPLTITINDEEVFTGKVNRSAAVLVKTLEERGDPQLMYCAELALDVPPPRVAVPVTTAMVGYPRPADPALAQAVDAALRRAGPNAVELVKALADADQDCRPGMFFLIANLPDRDLVTLPASFLVENVRLAYQAWRRAPWSSQVSEQQFFQYILPFAHLNERRDNWRRDFFERFHSRAWEFEDPLAATGWISSTLNDALNVHYHAHKRPKSDQSPYESIAAGYASCTGLSILLANACRAVGIPARLVGVPCWLNGSGNHTWVEVWGGPSEPTDGVALRCWHNVGDTVSDPRASDWVNETCRDQTDADLPRHSVYAACFRRTGVHFPLAWDFDIDYVPALNVTRFHKDLAPVDVHLPGGGRGQAVVYWRDEIWLTALAQDLVRLRLPRGETFRVVAIGPGGQQREEIIRP